MDLFQKSLRWKSFLIGENCSRGHGFNICIFVFRLGFIIFYKKELSKIFYFNLYQKSDRFMFEKKEQYSFRRTLD